MADTYTVAMITDYGWTETCHPLAVGVALPIAKSIYRHFNKLCSYNEYSGTGTYVTLISRTYCLNHADFESETTV